MKGTIVGFLVYLAIIVFVIVGEIKCAVKAIRCDWDPIGKAEIIYTGSFFCGVGAIVGWIDIEDSKPEPPQPEQVSMNTIMPQPVYITQPKNFATRRM